VNDPKQRIAWFSKMGDDLPESFSAYEDFADIDDPAGSEPAIGLVSIGFIGGALRRGARLWLVLAVVGLLLGLGWYAKSPPAQKASVSLLLVDNPAEVPSNEILTDIAMAQSSTVATAVVHQLGLSQTPSSFLGTYTATQVSGQVLTITVKAPNGAAAVQRASAVAEQFLKFRARYTNSQQQQLEAQLNAQVNQAQQKVDALTSQINQLSSLPTTPAQKAQLNSLQTQNGQAINTLTEVRQYATDTVASTRATTRQIVSGSQVLDNATLLSHSTLKGGLLYGGGGLLGGLIVGMAIVIVGAVASGRLLRRDDIAYAIGAPVRLSVGPLPGTRRLPDVLGLGAARRRDSERVLEHLRNAVPRSPRGPVGLAVVAVDNEQVVAREIVALAVSIAKEGSRVVLADLSTGAHAARILHTSGPGVSTVSMEGANIVVMVPARDDVAPVGPLVGQAGQNGRQPADESLASADVVLSLVTLDPAFGGDYLATWATEVVAVVTAGQSTVVRVRAVGEMVRLAGTPLISVMVIDSDSRDESLGATSTALQFTSS
jgi:hypothetical protein